MKHMHLMSSAAACGLLAIRAESDVTDAQILAAVEALKTSTNAKLAELEAGMDDNATKLAAAHLAGTLGGGGTDVTAAGGSGIPARLRCLHAAWCDGAGSEGRGGARQRPARGDQGRNVERRQRERWLPGAGRVGSSGSYRAARKEPDAAPRYRRSDAGRGLLDALER